jgi:serine/threonine protein kinase/Tol biopolymer transport system component
MHREHTCGSARLIASHAFCDPNDQMMLDAGTKLGRYEIRSKIGEGGMGEVYLARDTQLDRDVAIKVLTAQIARDQQRLHRFLQEARAAAGLSHPNIAHIYEIGEADDGYFIAMEYVEGITLDQKIAARPLSVGESLDIALQLTDALDEAHSNGITHRDIKSSNIMVTPRGRVKVLDFGLAKVAQAASRERVSDSEIATRVKTSPGVVMGTVNYMSPEQASGKEVDTRTDVWSVGVVLYEMVTGRLPFEGPTPSHIIVAILEKEPLPLSAHVPNLPEALDWIVTEALTKHVAERTQTARELLKKLQRLKQRVDATAEVERSVAPDPLPPTRSDAAASSVSIHSAPTTISDVVPGTREVTVPPTHVSSAEYVVNQIKGHKKSFAVVAIIAFIFLAGVSFALYKLLGKRTESAISFEAAKFTRLTTTGNATGAAISPDGKWLVHVQDDGELKSLWLRQVAVANSNTQIVPPAKIRFSGLAFSPDGNYVYYTLLNQGEEQTATLYQVPVLGGAARKILTGVRSSISFSPDGKQIAYFDFYEDEDRLMIANADGSGARKLAGRGGDDFFYQGDFASVSWSPDGKTIATMIANSTQNFMSIATVPLATGEVKPLTTRRWYNVQQVVWFDANTILATTEERNAEPVSISQIAYPSGTVTKLTNDLNSYPIISLTTNRDSIAAVMTDVEDNIWMMPAFDASKAVQITQGHNLVAWPAFTPDGKLIYSQKEPAGGDMYLYDPSNGTRKQLTADAAGNVEAAVSADGRYIVFMSDRTGTPHIWRMDLDGSNVKQLTFDQLEDLPSISPNGQWVVYRSCLNKCTLRKIGIDGGQPVQLTDKMSGSPTFSPDGKQIACTYSEQPTSHFQLAILPSEGGQPIKTFALPNGGGIFRWSTDGRALVYSVTQKGVSNLWEQPIDGSPLKQLTNFASEHIFQFNFSKDGKQLVLARGTRTNDVVLISNFKR